MRLRARVADGQDEMAGPLVPICRRRHPKVTARDAKQASRITLAVREYGQTGQGDLKKLKGSETWRLRAGDWRVFIEFDGDKAHVTGFSDRQDAY